MKNIRKVGIIFLLLFGLIQLVTNDYEKNAMASDNLATKTPISLTSTVESNYFSQFASKILASGNFAVPITNIQDFLNNQVSPKPMLAAPRPQISTYTVKPGDTLWDIANTYGITVEQLAAVNNLNNVSLSLGEKLIVTGQAQTKPSSGPPRAPVTSSRSGQPSQAGAIIQLATKYLNTPYRWGGTDPRGFDCSGFVQYVYARFGYKLPRTAAEQATVGVKIDRANLMPGDLVFLALDGSGISHVGIYTGNGRYINSSSPRDGGVINSPLPSRGYAGARRIIMHN